MNDLPDKTAADEHTLITDKILEVIDQQPTNRYAVALRLTRWYETELAAAQLRLIEGLLEQKVEVNTVNYHYPKGSTVIGGFTNSAVPVPIIEQALATIKKGMKS